MKVQDNLLGDAPARAIVSSGLDLVSASSPSIEPLPFRPSTLRPSERVMQYLVAEFDRPDLQEGSRLPTIRELADRLRVSAPTVQTVFRKLARQGRIRSRRGRGTFLVSRRHNRPASRRILVSISLATEPTSDEWISAISGGIFQASLRSKPPMTLMGLSPEIEGTDAVPHRLLAERTRVAGLILFPHCLHPSSVRDEVCTAYEREGTPVVHLHPPSETATANFVSFDYFGAGQLLGQAWRKTGRRRILMLAGPRMIDTISARLRHAGLVHGLGEDLGGRISLRLIEGVGQTEEDGYRTIQALFSEPGFTPPDAIYCTGHLVTLGLLRSLGERSVRVPAEISVAAGTGGDFSDTRWPRLTQTKQPLTRLGEELVNMLHDRIQQRGASLPGKILASSFTGGATTRPEENILLNIPSLTETNRSNP